MHIPRYTKFVFLCLISTLLCACSTTRLLTQDQYRLASSEIKINSDALKSSELNPYMRQQAASKVLFGWNPLESVYNWSDDPESVWHKIGVAPVIFNPNLVQSSEENIAKRLEYLGYYNSKVSSELTTKGKNANLLYKVDLGRRIQIDSIHYDICEGEIREDFFVDIDNVGIKLGDYLSEAALEAESQRSANVLREKGYYDFNKNHYFFEADTLGSKNILHYRIKGYTRNESENNDATVVKYRFRNVSIQHGSNFRIREDVLRKLNTIKPGKLYSESIVNSTYYRLSALNLFNNVNIALSPVDSALIDCNINLASSDLYGFKINAEVSSNSSGLFGVSPTLSFYHKNLFNGGERLNMNLSGNWQFLPGRDVASTEIAVSANLSFPFLAGLNNTNANTIAHRDFSASFNYQNRPEYTRSVASLAYGYVGQFGKEIYYQIHPLRVNYVKLFDLGPDFMFTLVENPYLWDTFMDHIDLGLGLTVYHTTDPAIVPKTAYSFSRFSLDLSGNLLSAFNKYLSYDTQYKEYNLFGVPYNQYVRAELALGKVFRFGRDDRNALALRLNAGIGKAYGNSHALPFEKQFYCGGASSMRGWQVRTLGPDNEQLNKLFTIPSQTGDMKIELDAELRFPIVWKLEGALFAEAGNIWQLDTIKNINFLDSIAADWGVGIRLNLDFILLRFDAGLRIHDPARAEGHRWVKAKDWFGPEGAAIHFGVGYPF